MQLGFVIDHSRCIGCHACTVACKAENEVPLGRFRTWVKYTERGTFPEIRRSFAVLRCNQCSDAPCVTICPVRALEKRTDGIVDIDPQRCIGCKSCMQACPYDALYINDDSGVAEKCHFCAHRTENGLAPACAVVCPTEAIVPGDFDDPTSRVARMKAAGGLGARKPEAGTRPNVWYKEVDPAGIAPLETRVAGGYLWAETLPGGVSLDARTIDALESRASARTTYDVPRSAPWGGLISAYLFTKSLAAGIALAALPLWDPLSFGDGLDRLTVAGILGLSLIFLAVTGALLVLDLKRPGRFWYILRYPNWSSWLVRGTWVLMAFGAVLSACIGLLLADVTPAKPIALLIVVAVVICAALSASYTAWLFGQAKGRVLWLARGMPATLLAHAVAGGAALLLLAGVPAGLPRFALDLLRMPLVAAVAVHLLLALGHGRATAPRRAEEYRRARRLLTHGPWARRHWWGGVVLGGVLPLLLAIIPDAPVLWMLGAAAALIGLYIDQDTTVRAGQGLPIS